MGFYWLAPFFIFRRHDPAWARFFLAFGICFGLLMGLTRMVQGSHFPSDVLWSFGFVYLTGWVLERLLRPGGWRHARTNGA
jgi:membrane-associated PAP2 superfamily phosphatase